MRIESLAQKPDRGGRFLLRLDDGSTLRLYRQTVEDFGLCPGTELTEEALEALREAAGEMSAKMRAVRIVAASNVSQRDLEARLIRKGETSENAREAVAWMAELNLVDDRETARQLVERCVSRGYGRARAKQLLYEKQIPRELWDEALLDYPDQEAAILSFLRSRLSPESDRKEKQRAVDALLRRGHRWEDIRRCLSRLGEDTGEYPED